MKQPKDVSPQDQDRLAAANERLTARNGVEPAEPEATPPVVTHLASLRPEADDVFRRQLEERLLASLAAQSGAATEARPSLTPDRARESRRHWYQLLTQGDWTMKKTIAIAVTFLLLIFGGTVALVPSVRAEMARVFNLTITGVETRFLQPTYLPDGFEQAFITVESDQNVKKHEGQEDVKALAEELALRYHDGDRFMVISQINAPDERGLPEGEPVTVQGYSGVLIEGLSGQVEVGFKVTNDAGDVGDGSEPVVIKEVEKEIINGEEKTVERETSSVETEPIIIDYTDGRQLIWYTDELKIDILTNLSPDELSQVAEGLAPDPE